MKFHSFQIFHGQLLVVLLETGSIEATQLQSRRPHEVTVPNFPWHYHQHKKNLCGRRFMEWISMSEQLHTSLTSPSIMASIGWSDEKHMSVESGAEETCS